MIIPPKFYYEVQHPRLGDKAYFVIRYLTQREAKAALVNVHGCALMTNLYIHPDHRAEGVGKELLRMLKQWQDKTETDVVFLASPYPRTSTPHLDIWCLKNFYSSHGFPEIEGTAYHGRINKMRN